MIKRSNEVLELIYDHQNGCAGVCLTRLPPIQERTLDLETANAIFADSYRLEKILSQESASAASRGRRRVEGEARRTPTHGTDEQSQEPSLHHSSGGPKLPKSNYGTRFPKSVTRKHKYLATQKLLWITRHSGKAVRACKSEHPIMDDAPPQDYFSTSGLKEIKYCMILKNHGRSYLISKMDPARLHKTKHDYARLRRT